jgi:TRAP-type C4-dicarboxylate transport system permease small subunit
MRRLLEGLYRLSGWLAAGCVIGIGTLVCTQVGLNVADIISGAVAAQTLGLSIPSYAELAGYLLTGASFLALAPTWRSGGHIRVTLALDRLPERQAHWAEVWAVSVVAAITIFLAFHVCGLSIESWRYGDVSPGLVPVPLWLPQSVMAFGLLILIVAQFESLIERLTGQREPNHGGACVRRQRGAGAGTGLMPSLPGRRADRRGRRSP